MTWKPKKQDPDKCECGKKFHDRSISKDLKIRTCEPCKRVLRVRKCAPRLEMG